MKRQKICHWTTVIAGVLYCAGACQQQAAGEEFTAVNWIGDYIPTGDITTPPSPPAYTYLNGHIGLDSLPSYVDPDVSGTTTGRIANDVTRYNPLGGGYQQPTRLSSVFYGGHVVQWATTTGNPGFNDLQVENKTPFVTADTADYMHLSVLPDPDLRRYAALFYWKKDNFVNGFSAPGNLVTLTGNNTFLLNVIPTTLVSPPNPVDKEVVRWVVRNNADFYISRTIEQIPTNTLDAFAITKVKDIIWESWNPLGGNLSDIFFASGVPALTSSFTNITALGFYLSSEDADSSNNSMNMLIKQFTVTANANVPEPGFALVGLFGVGLFAVRQLKSRRSKSSAIPAEDFQAVS